MAAWAGYEQLGLVNQGTHGKLTKVRRTRDDKLLVCKIIRVDGPEGNREHANRECIILNKLQHWSILEYHDFQIVRDHVVANALGSSCKIILFMEHCTEGSLQDYINDARAGMRAKPKETMVWDVILQLGLALTYCHHGIKNNGTRQDQNWSPVLHRNIKPANVLIYAHQKETLQVKLADFGLATFMEGSREYGVDVGFQIYQPPEIRRSRPYGIKWNTSSDIFSLGCSMYAFCALRPPFPYQKEADYICPAMPDEYSDNLKVCIRKCQATSQADRPDAFELVGISYDVPRSGMTRVHQVSSDIATGALAAVLAVYSDTKKERRVTLCKPVEYREAERTLLDAVVQLLGPCWSDSKECDEVTSYGIYWLGRLRVELGDHTGAEEAFLTVVRINQNDAYRRYREDSFQTLCWLGETQVRLGKLPVAETTFQEAIRVDEYIYGRFTRPHMSTVDSMWWGLQPDRSLIRQEWVQRGIFTAAEQVYGVNSGKTLRFRMAVGLLQCALGQYLDAEHTLKKWEEYDSTSVVSVMDRNVVAQGLYHLGMIRVKLGRHQAGKQNHLRALAILEQNGFDDEAANMANRLRELGVLEPGLATSTESPQGSPQPVEVGVKNTPVTKKPSSSEDGVDIPIQYASGDKCGFNRFNSERGTRDSARRQSVLKRLFSSSNK